MIYLIHQLIEQWAARNPDREAIRFREHTLTYAQLDEKANKLAALLRQRGLQRGGRVGIYQNKSIETAIALYGIMKAGAAYVPLDPAAPPARTAFVIRDCGVRHLITQDKNAPALRSFAGDGLELDCLIGPSAETELPYSSFSWDQVFATAAALEAAPAVMEGDLAYIIYTSGSTGTPKGIMHTHASGLSYARWAAHNYGLRPDDRLANHVPIHFDISTFDFFAGAVAGATTVIIPEQYLKIPASYAQLLAQEKVSVIFTVPFALIQLLLRGNLQAQDLSAMRWIVFGGEPFPLKHLRDLMEALPWVKFNNMYGPTETNGVTNYTVPPGAAGEDGSVPIGRMARNTEGFIADASDQPVSDGEAGELLVRSPTMMQGYWERPDLNDRAFYRRTVASGYDHVFYRTGDLVRARSDGNLVFLGRKDRQVKIRGYRVELDEIEAALCAHPGVEEAAAVAVPGEDGSNRILASVTAKDTNEINPAALNAFLRERVPPYAVPDELRIEDTFPRTSTGKIDRKSLRERALAGAAGQPAAEG